jgi:hypothetical protein
MRKKLNKNKKKNRKIMIQEMKKRIAEIKT